MKNNIKSIIAAVLAVACLSGCSANSDGYSAPSSVSTTSSSSSSSYSSSSEEISTVLPSEPELVSEPKTSSVDDSEPETSESDASDVETSEPNESGSKYYSPGDIVISLKLDSENSGSSSASGSSSSIAITMVHDSDCDCYKYKKQDVCLIEPTEDHIGQLGSQCVNCGFTTFAWYTNYFTNEKYSTAEYAEKALAEHKADKAAQDLIDKLGLNSGGKSDIEKLCILNKWFYDNTKYDATLERHRAYDILVDGLGVCSSYAEALCIILPKCGIDTYYCSSDKLNHAWNAVKIDGQWTYTDFTGGIDSNSDVVILGSSCHGVPDYIEVRKYFTDGGRTFVQDFDFSAVSTNLLFDTCRTEHYFPKRSENNNPKIFAKLSILLEIFW